MAEIAMNLIDKFFNIFRDRMGEVEQSYREIRKTRTDINRRLDFLENEIRQAEVNGEDRWFFCVRKKEVKDD